jgi:hypothetical protein
VRAEGKTALFAVQGMINTALVIGLNILFLAVLHYGVIGYVLSVVLADVACALLLFVREKLWRQFTLHPGGIWKKMLVYSIPMIPTTIFWWITNVSDRYMVSAIISAGAITDAVIYQGSTAEIPVIKQTYPAVMGDVPYFFCLGNHDSAGGSNAQLFYDTLGDWFYRNDLDKEAARNEANRYMKLGGYHFLAVEGTYSGTGYETSTITWLENKLKAITADKSYKGEYIFIITHSPLRGTVYGSESDGYTGLITLLKKYPQAVVICGHLHRTLFDERAIWQENYTEVSAGALYEYWTRKDCVPDYITGIWSTDGGYHFNKTGRPWRKDAAGSTSVVYHEGRYYVFYGTKVYVTANPLDGENAEAFPTISLGGGPSNFDDKSLWGNMVWRIKGVDKWFMTYQGSSSHGDFPDRFHVAVSDDLLHWTKVDNSRPLFTRGAAGQWDQGAIWCPEVFEHEGMLYLYYEGWGTPGDVYDRNKVYFRPARSRLGGASCSVADFLEWCGLSKKDEL